MAPSPFALSMTLQEGNHVSLQEQETPERAVSGQAAPGTTSGAWLQTLLRVPDLATAEDREQAAGIVSLAALLQVGPP